MRPSAKIDEHARGNYWRKLRRQIKMGRIGVAMAPNIRDKDVDRLAMQLATARHSQAASLADRLRALQDQVLAHSETDLSADKDFFDSLNGEA